MHRLRRRRVSISVRRKISQSLKRYHQEQQRIAGMLARERARERRRVSILSPVPVKDRRGVRALLKQAEFLRRSEVARKGWETRRRAIEEAERAKRRKRRKRQAEEQARAEREARRLKKWRASYRKYLEFRVPKKEREELETPAKKELVCRVLFDADDPGTHEEHIWVNLRHVVGDSISHILLAVPADEGIVRATFRLIAGEDFVAMQRGEAEDVDDYGDLMELEWESDVEPERFWPQYFAYARTLLPNRAEGRQSPAYNASWLGVVRLEICYEVGQISAD